MRARVFVLGMLLIAAILAGMPTSTADLSPLMPPIDSLSSFGFPASLLETQGGMQPYGISPDALFSSGFLPDTSSTQAFNSLMPGLSGTLSGFPALSGLGSFSTPSYKPLMPAISLPDFSVLQMPSSGLQQGIMNNNPGASPSTVNNYTEASNGRTITVNRGDIIHVQLPSRIDQGYIWNASVTDGLNVTNMVMYPPEQISPISGTGEVALQSTQQWDVQAVKPGTQHFTAEYRRPWADGPDDKEYTLTVIVV